MKNKELVAKIVVLEKQLTKLTTDAEDKRIKQEDLMASLFAKITPGFKASFVYQGIGDVLSGEYHPEYDVIRLNAVGSVLFTRDVVDDLIEWLQNINKE